MSARLSRNSFAGYPPQGREIALAHLSTFQRTPLSVLAAFLGDLREYDWKFPQEQEEILRRIGFLENNPSSVAPFAAIQLPHSLERSSCGERPRQFSAELSAYLWSSLQMDPYRKAAARFMEAYRAAVRPVLPPAPRLAVVMIGQGAHPPDYPLFQKLRPHGQIRTRIDASGSTAAILAALEKRSRRNPAAYAHWYIDGGNPPPGASRAGITQVAWPALAPVDQRILEHMTECIRAGKGPEALQAEFARLSPSDLSADKVSADPRIQHFVVSLLTQGSGTQIFSTTFVQWTAREVLRRAQPETLIARYAPRQRQQSFNAMVRAASGTPALDLDGSLMDGDMGAYYTYLELKGLPGAEKAAFLVWFEGHSQVFYAGPGIPADTSSDSPSTMADLLAELSNAQAV